MSDSRHRDVSSTRRSRSSRAVSPVVSFADRQMDAQARAALDRAETAAARQGIAYIKDNRQATPSPPSRTMCGITGGLKPKILINLNKKSMCRS